MAHTEVQIHLGDEVLKKLIRRSVRLALQPLGVQMATATEAIAALTAQADANATVLADVFADVRALIVLLSVEPQLTAETQAAVDALGVKLSAEAAEVAVLDAEVGDADGSDAVPAPVV